MLTLDRLEDIEHARFRAQAQIMLTINADKQDAGIEAFEDYMNVAFPTLKTKKKKTAERAHEALRSWIAQGPLNVTPMAQPVRAKSRMIERIASIEGGEVAKFTTKMRSHRT